VTGFAGNDEIRMSNVETISNDRSSELVGLSLKIRDSNFRLCFGFRISNFGFCDEAAFTIIELLVVIALIIILAGLILSTVGYVQNKAARSRAETEIAAISAALENYKADNGIYPRDPTPNTATDKLDPRTMLDAAGTNAAAYKLPSLVLYRATSGDRDLNRIVDSSDKTVNIDGSTLTPAPTDLPKTYFSFKPNQLSPSDQTQKIQYLRDPFGNSYGYSTAYQYDVDTNINPPTHGYNPTYDLWSTAGSANQTQWIKNW
jgi:type II secretory pathway pseudopilin PulG